MDVLLLHFLSTAVSEHEAYIVYGGMNETRATKDVLVHILSHERQVNA